MIVDSSALVAASSRESDREVLSHRMGSADTLRISAASYVECAIVIDARRDAVLTARFDSLLQDLRMTIEPVTAEQARIARQAYRDYGRGSGHPANLNFGDCFSYALAREKREPILFKGNNSSRTDLRSAMNE